MRIAVYARVSTDSESQEGSLEHQKTHFLKQIEENDHSLYNVYYDNGLTGTKLDNRPGFRDLLFDAGIDIKRLTKSKKYNEQHVIFEASDREPLFDEIWTTNTSRFARNILAYTIIQKLRQKNVAVWFVQQGINTANTQQDFMLQLMQTFDAHDSRDKSGKVRNGILDGINKGVIHTNSKLYGYTYNKVENKLEIIEDEAQVIKLIFDLYSKNKGFRQIGNYLKENNIFTRQQKPFGKTSLRNIIRNEKYAGLNNPLKYDTGEVFNKNTYAKVKETYDVYESDKIPAIISQDMFEKCEKILKSNISHTTQKGLNKGDSKYSRFLYCGKCGHTYYSNVDRGRIFYCCSNKKANGTSVCDNPNVSQKTVDAYIEDLATGSINEYLNETFLLIEEKTFRIIQGLLDLVSKKDEEEIRCLHEEIEKSDKRLVNFYELYANESDDKKILKKMIEKVLDEKKELDAKYHFLTQTSETIHDKIRAIYGNYMYIKGIVEHQKERYTVDEVLDVVSSIRVQVNRYGETELISQVADDALSEFKTFKKSLQDEAAISGAVDKEFYISSKNMLSEERIEELTAIVKNLPKYEVL